MENSVAAFYLIAILSVYILGLYVKKWIEENGLDLLPII